jgi:hypothetical protein
MAVWLFQAGLVHVLVRVLGPVVVGVGVFMGHVVVGMRGVRVGMGLLAVLVLVRMRRIVSVLLGHGPSLPLRNLLIFRQIHGF